MRRYPLTAQHVYYIVLMPFSGFNYQFEALTDDPKENELNQAFSTIFRSGAKMTLILILKEMVPVLRFLVCQNQMSLTVHLIIHIADL